MNKLKILIIGLNLLFTTHAFGQDNWKEYNYKSHNFKVNLYQAPEISIDSSTFDNSPQHTYSWEVNVSDSLHENSYYSVSSVSYHSDFIHSDSLFPVVEGFINSTQNEILDDKEYTLLSSTLIQKHGFPGKEFKWKNNSSNINFRFQVFLVENNLFQLSVVSREGKDHNIFINSFFDSFDILNIPKGNFTIPKLTNERTYSIEFPENPSEQIKIIDSEYGKLSLNIQIYEPKDKSDNLAYIAMETKYPTATVNQDDTYALNTFYKKSINGSLTSVNGELISINDIYIGKKLGKEYKCYFSGGKALMTYRIFYIDDRLFTFGIICPSAKDENKKMRKFLKSFKFLQ